jgi:branched-chain amino acid transport system ATP-binding protein
MGFLELRQVSKYFGNLHAIENLTLEIEKGKVTAIIGPNGAGKTTVFNLITGWHKATAGRIVFKGEEITHLHTYQILRRGIGRSFQIINIFNNLSVYENIRMGILANEKKGFIFLRPVESGSYQAIREKTLQLIETVGLTREMNTMASILSHGDQKALEIGIALSTEPELLLLDEPTAGMSLEESRYTTNLIKEVSEERGITILFTEHDLDMVFSIAARIIVLDQGEIICDGDERCVKENKQVQEAYMGRGE